MITTKKAFTLLLILVITIFPILLQAQFNDPDDVIDNAVPFDGGISLLVIAVTGYGLQKANDKKKVDHQKRLSKN